MGLRLGRWPRTRPRAGRETIGGGEEASGGEADDARHASRRVGPRPTKKSRAAAEAAAERARLAAEARAARLREAEAVVGSFAPFKASPAPSPAKPARFSSPVRGAGTRASPGAARPSPGGEGRTSPPIRSSSASGSSRRDEKKGRKNVGSPSDRLVAARALLADLESGVPVDPDARVERNGGAAAPKSTWHELKEAGRRSVARVRAYQSAEGSPPGAVPAHERYQHYKMMGFGGMGAKTSWAR